MRAFEVQGPWQYKAFELRRESTLLDDFPTRMSSIMVRQYTNIAGLVLLVYDQIITWDREVNRIWRSSDRALKTMFFLGRYLALAIQIINLVVSHPDVLEKQMMDCHKWFGFQTSVVLLLLLNLRLVFTLRLYALYERSTKIAAFLLSGFVFYTPGLFLIGSRLVPQLKLDSSCMAMESANSKAIISFTVICMLDHCIIWGLTANKYRDAIRRGWSTNPILRLVMRDTSWSCLAICGLFIAAIPYSMMVGRIGHIIYCIFSSLISVLTCRTLLNMRGLSGSEGPLSIDITTVELELTDFTQSE
ncbi:hypothetical protein Agabi119p4_11272 [Agaricus bisporus var. burnettii]|uniref:DUF6533 domain-containing protein n=1 Tax=Agaricus bisporus var. burnettii TaxID=192524 RepID=A0A8H7C245_AGABI|nr:hypothetical protein Agabi119p4_11272 [Agaricus bisporus var. burnettii]